MGGLARSCRGRTSLPRRRARARGHPHLLRLLVEGRDHRGRVRERRRPRRVPLRAGLAGALLTGSTRSASTSPSSAASERPRGGARTRGTRRGAAVDARPGRRRSCSRRSAGSSSSRVWEPFLHWIDETAEPLVRRRSPRTTGRARSPSRSLSSGSSWHGARSVRAGNRHRPGVWRISEHKLYFDELYDALFYRPAVALANALRRNVEEPIVERRSTRSARGRSRSAARSRVQSGLLRTYALAIAFAVVRPRRRLRGGALADADDALILLPVAGALSSPCSRSAKRDRGPRVPRRADGGRALDRRRSAFDFDDGGLQLGTSREWVESLGISYSVGFYGFSLWLAGARSIVFAAAIGYAVWVGRDRPARTTRTDALPERRGRSRPSPRRTSCSSTSRSRRC